MGLPKSKNRHGGVTTVFGVRQPPRQLYLIARAAQRAGQAAQSARQYSRSRAPSSRWRQGTFAAVGAARRPAMRHAPPA
eukprot:2246419-Pleurochrysis_carterae.AAC.2